MGFFSHDSEESQQWQECNQMSQGGNDSEAHKSKFSHEFISGAAAYEASKAWENHKEKNGEPESHAKAKEIAAGFAGAYVDRLVETHGMDYVDKERAKRQAQEKVEVAIDDNGY